MNSLKSLTFSLILCALTGTAGAQSFPSLVGTGKIGLCPGVVPHVLKVEVLGSTQSGGCCGTDEEWRQDQLDLRRLFEDRIRGFNYAGLEHDDSLTRTIDPAILTMETHSIRDATVSACLSRFDFVNVVQNHRDGTNVWFNLGYKIFLTTGPATDRRSILVQELAGTTKAHTDFFHTFYLSDMRVQLVLTKSWNVVKGNFDKFLVPVESAEAAQGMQLIKSELGDFTDTNIN